MASPAATALTNITLIGAVSGLVLGGIYALLAIMTRRAYFSLADRTKFEHPHIAESSMLSAFGFATAMACLYGGYGTVVITATVLEVPFILWWAYLATMVVLTLSLCKYQNIDSYLLPIAPAVSTLAIILMTEVAANTNAAILARVILSIAAGAAWLYLPVAMWHYTESSPSWGIIIGVFIGSGLYVVPGIIISGCHVLHMYLTSIVLYTCGSAVLIVLIPGCLLYANKGGVSSSYSSLASSTSSKKAKKERNV